MLTLFPSRTAICALLLISFLSTAMDAQCAHPDVPALTSLYDATNGDDWTENTGWLSNCEPCGWAGIGCDADNRVTSIKLNSNGLTGELPVTLDGLDLLETFNLSYNSIGGELPAVVFTLAGVKELRLNGNLLTGSLPAAVGQLSELEELRLQSNQLSGDLPLELSNLLGLKVLMMSFNNFTGSIPEGFGDLPDLQVLGFTNNDLAGCFPTDLKIMCEGSRVLFGGNDKLSWKGDFSQLCVDGLDETQIGAPCDDGDPDTGGDVITQDCGCLGGVTAGEGLTGLAGYTEENALDAGGEVQVINPVASGSPVLNNTAPTVYDVAVYPNPVIGNEITVSLPNDAGSSTLRLLSLTGRELLKQTSSQTSTVVNLPVLQAGIYLVEVVSESGRSVKRVIVQ